MWWSTATGMPLGKCWMLISLLWRLLVGHGVSKLLQLTFRPSGPCFPVCWLFHTDRWRLMIFLNCIFWELSLHPRSMCSFAGFKLVTAQKKHSICLMAPSPAGKRRGERIKAPLQNVCLTRTAARYAAPSSKWAAALSLGCDIVSGLDHYLCDGARRRGRPRGPEAPCPKELRAATPGAASGIPVPLRGIGTRVARWATECSQAPLSTLYRS